MTRLLSLIVIAIAFVMLLASGAAAKSTSSSLVRQRMNAALQGNVDLNVNVNRPPRKPSADEPGSALADDTPVINVPIPPPQPFTIPKTAGEAVELMKRVLILPPSAPFWAAFLPDAKGMDSPAQITASAKTYTSGTTYSGYGKFVREDWNDPTRDSYQNVVGKLINNHRCTKDPTSTVELILITCPDSTVHKFKMDKTKKFYVLSRGLRHLNSDQLGIFARVTNRGAIAPKDKTQININMFGSFAKEAIAEYNRATKQLYPV